MSAQNVISFEEYRRRRAASQASSQAPVQPQVMWYPVWVLVPYYPAPEPSLGMVVPALR